MLTAFFSVTLPQENSDPRCAAPSGQVELRHIVDDGHGPTAAARSFWVAEGTRRAARFQGLATCGDTHQEWILRCFFRGGS